MSTCGSTRKVEFDLFERDLAFTARNRVQPTATSCDLLHKGLGSVPTFASGAPRNGPERVRDAKVAGSNPVAPTSFNFR